MKKTVDYTSLCTYDNAFKYMVDVVVYSDEFALGNKGDHLSFAVSEYGFARLMKDSWEGLIDITDHSAVIEAFDYPDYDWLLNTITDYDEHYRKLLIDAIKNGKPVPEEIKKIIHNID